MAVKTVKVGFQARRTNRRLKIQNLRRELATRTNVGSDCRRPKSHLPPKKAIARRSYPWTGG